jgi:NAD(P)-dependent dehydrogenase (short-subunit alcohol dehydrogenase family)
MTDRLAGRVALVTGGGRGIGRAIALALAADGAKVAVSARSQDQIEAAAGEIEAQGGEALAVGCDISDKEQVARMVDAVTTGLGPIDILINNAGASGSHKFLGHPDELWHRLLGINLTGTYYVSKAVAPGMVERGWGRIVNIASVAARTGVAYAAAYAASKHGVLGLTRTIALELVRSGVTVNAVCPGYVDTPMTDESIANVVGKTRLSEDEARHAVEKMTPQNRLFDPEEVVVVVMMLVGEDARGITGQAINVDGGAVMS